MCKIVTPVVTVFDKNEKPDYEGNKKVIDFLTCSVMYLNCDIDLQQLDKLLFRSYQMHIDKFVDNYI